MSLQSTSLVIQMAPIPQTFRGTPQELSAEMVRRMKILSPSGANFIFVGDSEPTSNVGPWLKDGTKWYVWDDTVNRYVPQDITDSEQRWFWIGASTPSDVDPPLWMRTTKDASESDPTYGSPLSWYQWNGSAWVPFVGLVLSGPTANRPVTPETYQLYYDTDILCLIWQLLPFESRKAILSVCGSFDKLPGYYVTPKPECFAAAWERMMQADTAVLIGAIAGIGCYGGFLAGCILPDLMSGKMQALEYLWMVAPDHRQDGTAVRLLKEFERVAEYRGCETVVCGCMAAERPDAMRRMYRRLGFKPHGETFWKGIKIWAQS